MDLVARVREFIISRQLLRAGDRVVVGVSGGPDSLCLLYVLQTLKAELALTLAVAHLDHGLRPSAADEAAFVRGQAEALGLPFHVGRADTQAQASTHGQSLEEAARTVRYAFLASVARETGARQIAVAHTADDQAETVLMHFLRGAGLAGLKGMLPVTGLGSEGLEELPAASLHIIRPLLGTTRAEVEAYCAALGQAPRRDESNADTRFLRNRLRHELLPLLETYNPQLRAGLVRSAEVLAGEHALVAAHMRAVWAAAAPAERQAAERVVFDRARWLALTVAEQRALLREAVQRLRQHLRDVDFTPLAAAVRFAQGAVPGHGCDLLAGLRLAIEPEAVVVHPWGTEPLPLARAGPWLNADGSLAAGWKFAVELVEADEWVPGQAAPPAASAWTAYVDAAALNASLCLRGRQPGDRFQPLGLGGHSTKLSHFMVNQKVAAALRARWPLVVCGPQIVWVAGLRLDERYKVQAGTQRVVRLRFREA
jgi:tRNA(Ile)-lysidine synthase